MCPFTFTPVKVFSGKLFHECHFRAIGSEEKQVAAHGRLLHGVMFNQSTLIFSYANMSSVSMSSPSNGKFILHLSHIWFCAKWTVGHV